MGNKNESKIVGVGDVCIRTNVGSLLWLKDVRHVLDVRLNLISVIALDCQGYLNCFCNKSWKLIKDSMVLARGAIVDDLYRTRVEAVGDYRYTEIVVSAMPYCLLFLTRSRFSFEEYASNERSKIIVLLDVL